MISPWHQQLRSFVKEVSLMVLTLEGRVQEVYPARPIQSSLQAVAGGPPQTGQYFSEFGDYPQTSLFSQRPMLDPESVMDAERLDIFGGFFQISFTDPQ